MVHQRGSRDVVFEVGQAWQLPDLASVVPAGGQVRDASAQETSTYFDTANGRLRSLGIILRQHHQAEDTSWILVLPDHGTQVVLGPSGTIPDSIGRQLDGVLTGADLIEVASVTTSHQTHQVVSDDGGILVEIADTNLSGVTRGASATVAQWREVTLRGGVGNGHEIPGLRKLVKQTGSATRVEPISPLDRLLDTPRAAASDAKVSGRLGDYLRAQCGEMLVSDVALRNHNDSAPVHRMRVAIRRLRSVLTEFSGVLEPGAASLTDDLRWTAQQLGAIRDLDVLDTRISAALDVLQAADLVGPVRRHLVETLATRRAHAYQAWQRTWADARYQHVMSAIAGWHLAPPVVPEAKVSAKKALARATRRVNRRLAAAHGDTIRLHQARKAAKRLRYVAEVLAPITGPGTRRAGARAKKLQTRLGQHLDALGAAALLAEQGRSAGARPDDNGYTYGLLVTQQRHLAEQALHGLPSRI